MIEPIDGPIRVSAPGRLHFGLFSVGRETTPSQFAYGGVGAMVDGPNTVIEICESDRFTADGQWHDRIKSATERWCTWLNENLDAGIDCIETLPCSIHVVESPELHSGLGTGTQLALSITVGLSRFFGVEVPAAEQLSRIARRGKRSAIGTWGFLRGGLIVDGGKKTESELGKLSKRVEIPQEWRIVVLTVDAAPGASGDFESNVFDQLAKTHKQSNESLREVCDEKIIAGIEGGDFDLFCRGVYEFNFRVGQRFSSMQNGPFNGPLVHQGVHAIRDLGFMGVGQSSWGPTIFAWVPNLGVADDLMAECQSNTAICFRRSWIAKPNNCGASIKSAGAQFSV